MLCKLLLNIYIFLKPYLEYPSVPYSCPGGECRQSISKWNIHPAYLEHEYLQVQIFVKPENTGSATQRLKGHNIVEMTR